MLVPVRTNCDHPIPPPQTAAWSSLGKCYAEKISIHLCFLSVSCTHYQIDTHIPGKLCHLPEPHLSGKILTPPWWV